MATRIGRYDVPVGNPRDRRIPRPAMRPVSVTMPAMPTGATVEYGSPAPVANRFAPLSGAGPALSIEQPELPSYMDTINGMGQPRGSFRAYSPQTGISMSGRVQPGMAIPDIPLTQPGAGQQMPMQQAAQTAAAPSYTTMPTATGISRVPSFREVQARMPELSNAQALKIASVLRNPASVNPSERAQVQAQWGQVIERAQVQDAMAAREGQMRFEMDKAALAPGARVESAQIGAEARRDTAGMRTESAERINQAKIAAQQSMTTERGQQALAQIEARLDGEQEQARRAGREVGSAQYALRLAAETQRELQRIGAQGDQTVRRDLTAMMVGALYQAWQATPATNGVGPGAAPNPEKAQLWQAFQGAVAAGGQAPGTAQPGATGQPASQPEAAGTGATPPPVGAAPPAGGMADGQDADGNGVPDGDAIANSRVNFLRVYERTMRTNPQDPFVTGNAAAYEVAKRKHSEWLRQQTGSQAVR